MAISHVLTVMASAMSAESIRMNLIASNLANVDSVSGSENETYRAKHPVFSEVKQQVEGLIQSEQPIGGVRVTDIIESKEPLTWRFDPQNPLADKQGRVYQTDVNPIEEMSNMIASSRQYQAAVEVMNTSKNLMMQTLRAINNL